MGNVRTNRAARRSPSQTRVWLADVVVVVGLFAVQLSTVAGDHNPGPLSGLPMAGAIVGVGMLGPLLVRRRWPAAVLMVVTAATVVSQLVHPLHLVVPAAAVAIAAYGAAVDAPHRSGRRAAVVCAAALAAMFSVMAFTADLPAEQWPPRLAMFLVLTGGAWVLGVQTRTSRDYSSELEVRTAELEHARQRSADQGASEERLRIARELHDLLGHHVSVMVMQAAGARRTLSSDVAKARGALEAIENAGRDAIAEMHRVLSVLRDPDARRRPDLEHLEQLVGDVRHAGVAVTLHLDPLPALPPSIDLAATRVVQEALTNVLRHAGPGTRAEVTVTAAHRTLDIVVKDDGHTQQRPPGTSLAGTGRGLAGLRERVELHGGQFDAGQRREGGFRVHAAIPIGPN